MAEEQENKAGQAEEREEKCCTYCKSKLTLDMRKYGLGGDGYGGLSSLLMEQYEVDIYRCPRCGRIELFAPEEEVIPPEEQDITCSVCGTKHSPLIGCPHCALTRAYSYAPREPKPKKKKDKLPWER